MNAKIKQPIQWDEENNLPKDNPKRYSNLARFIARGRDIIDIGCGAMHIEKYLPMGCTYKPYDVVKRDKRTELIDLNKGEFPKTKAYDQILLLDVLPYIDDVLSVLKSIKQSQQQALITYPCTNGKDTEERVRLGYVNHFTLEQFKTLVDKAGLRLFHAEPYRRLDTIFVLKPKEDFQETFVESRRHISSDKKVLVLSYNNVGNFGDRLGYHLINQILPPQVTVYWGNFQPFTVPSGVFDLLIIGIGNSLYQPMCIKELMDLTKMTKHVIGIFGTQFRHSLNKMYVSKLIDNMDYWFARFLEDKLLYGKHNDKVIHLGDWLTSTFPLSEPTILDKSYMISVDDVWKEPPLDRLMQNILSYGYVNSPGIHPLLCAFHGARAVAYRESLDKPGGKKTGKFRSMFMDVFGRDVLEGSVFDIERDKLIEYRLMVDDNLRKLQNAVIEVLS